jgi:hypothetical protein
MRRPELPGPTAVEECLLRWKLDRSVEEPLWVGSRLSLLSGNHSLPVQDKQWSRADARR